MAINKRRLKMAPETNQLIRTDRRRWNIVLRRKGYVFIYNHNSYPLENLKDKDECFVFRYNKRKDSRFLILISSEKEDYAGLICLTNTCEVLWEKNYAQVSNYWENITKKQEIYHRLFFNYSPIFQARNLLLKNIQTYTRRNNNENNKEENTKFFKNWLPFSLGIGVGIVYTFLGFFLLNL